MTTTSRAGSLLRAVRSASRPFRPVRAIRRAIEEFLIRAYRWLLHVLLRALARVLLFVTVAAASGIGSAWYMIDGGSALTTRHNGPWTVWPKAGRADADPYTRAHFSRLGMLPLAAPIADYYMATRDSDGAKLYADCEYEITGRGPEGGWWSLAVYDMSGTLVDGPGDRHSVSSPGLMRDTAGRFTIRLAPEARAGNWLPVSGQGGITLLMRVYQPTVPAADDTAAASPDALPAVRKVECR